MNLREFAALKPGDEVCNLMTNSRGTVTEITNDLVLVRWSVGSPPRTYGANTTAWMHWDKVEYTTEQT